MKAVPLNAYRKPDAPPKEKMDATTFFTTFVEMTKKNPPHTNDNPILDRMK